MTVARPKVLWWGVDPPPDVGRELSNRGLELAATEEEDTATNPEVRAVLLPSYPGKGMGAIASRAKRLRASVVDRGGSIFVVTFSGQAHRDAVVQTSGLSEIAVLDGGDAGAVAQACARIAPGHPVGPVEVECIKKTKLRPQDELLLRRAFGDFKVITVDALDGGLSGARIWSVHATAADGRKTMPFLVKADAFSAITSEIETTKHFVLDHMPFTNQPGLVEERCVAGLDRRLLVSRFVERADRLDGYLERKRSVEKVIRSIFDGPLRNWRQNASVATVHIGKDYSRRVRGHDGRHNDTLHRAHQLALSADPSTSSPHSLIEVIEQLPEREVSLCQAHGDLHPRNIFVRDNSEEIILIDFAHAGDLGNPIVRDAATLDVALAFDGWERAGTRLEPAEIEKVYAPPLLALRAEGLSHRAAAIVYVRQQAKIDARDEAEYTVAVIAMLLRTARLLAISEGDEGMRSKLIAVAIRCAERLVKTLP